MSQIVSDPRFAALHSDPRFQRIPARERKVAVDERFNAIFTDENFSDAALALDKRGRTPKKKKSKRASDETLQHVFDMRPEDDAIAHIRETTAGAAVKPKASAIATARKKRPAASGSANTNKGTSKKAASSTIATPVDSRKSKQHKGARRVPTARPSGSDDIAKALVQDNGGDDEITDGAGVWVREDDVDEREGGDEGEGETSEAETTEDEDDVEQGDADPEAESALMEWIEREAAVPRVKDATSRLAVVSLDWSQVRAVDLLAVLRSFLPSGGRVLSVAVYLSDFGAEQLEKEKVSGPTGIWADTEDDGNGAGAHGDRDDDDGDDDDDEKAGTAVDNEKLRKYELSRLDYYFAVVSCDSAATAEHIYEQCDGAEFEASAMALDLRFIPEEMQFTRTPRDQATELPPKYVSPSFMCSALQQSNVKLSWDDDDTNRKQVMKRDFSKAEIREMEYAAYLASSSESEDGEEEYPFDIAAPPPPKEQRKSSLQKLIGDEGDSKMLGELTFVPKLESKAREAAARRGGADEGPTVWDVAQKDFHRKRKERRNRRLAAKEEGGKDLGDDGHGDDDDDDDDGDDDDDEFGREADADGDISDDLDDDAIRNDPFFAEALEEEAEHDRRARASAEGERRAQSAAKSAPRGEDAPPRKRRKKGKHEALPTSAAELEAAAKQAAELELLMMGEGDGKERRGYDLKRLENQGTRAGKKAKKQKDEVAVDADDDFTLDLHDERFKRLYTSHDFAVDPTDPKFRKTEGSKQILQEISKRHEKIAPPSHESGNGYGGGGCGGGGGGGGGGGNSAKSAKSANGDSAGQKPAADATSAAGEDASLARLVSAVKRTTAKLPSPASVKHLQSVSLALKSAVRKEEKKQKKRANP